MFGHIFSAIPPIPHQLSAMNGTQPSRTPWERYMVSWLIMSSPRMRYQWQRKGQSCTLCEALPLRATSEHSSEWRDPLSLGWLRWEALLQPGRSLFWLTLQL